VGSPWITRALVSCSLTLGLAAAAAAQSIAVDRQRGLPDGVIVANADVFVPDGSRLEGVGVQPDVLALPTPDDLEKDPVLAKTAASFGVTIDSQRAGRLSRH
jgi:hypothetical protein